MQLTNINLESKLKALKPLLLRLLYGAVPKLSIATDESHSKEDGSSAGAAGDDLDIGGVDFSRDAANDAEVCAVNFDGGHIVAIDVPHGSEGRVDAVLGYGEQQVILTRAGGGDACVGHFWRDWDVGKMG